MADFYEFLVSNGYTDRTKVNYLWIYDMEWIQENEKDRYNCSENKEPFAITGGADVWVRDSADSGIYLNLHDTGEYEPYARSFTQAVFRAVTEYCCQNEFDENCSDENDECSVAFARKYVNDIADNFRNFLGDHLSDKLKKITENDIKLNTDKNYSWYSFLSDKECEDILKKEQIICTEENNEDDLTSCNLDDTDVTKESAVSDISKRTSFDKKFFDDLVPYAFKLADSYKYQHNLLFNKATESFSGETICYDKAKDIIYIYQISYSFANDIISGKQSDPDSSKAGIRYYMSSNRPVYSEQYTAAGVVRRTFYEYSTDKTTAITYMLIGSQAPKFLHAEENIFENGHLKSFMRCNLSEIKSYEKYFYSDTKLSFSESFISFKYDNDLSYITDKVSPDGINCGDRNPSMIKKYLYNYNAKGKMTDIEFQVCSDAEVETSQLKVKKKVYDFFKDSGIL